MIEAFFRAKDHSRDEYQVQVVAVSSIRRGKVKEEGYVLDASLRACLLELLDWGFSCHDVNWCTGFSIDGIMIDAPWLGPNGKFNTDLLTWVAELEAMQC